MFPWYRIERSTRAMVDEVLARGDIGPVLRRLLVEAADDLDRAIKCREYAGASSAAEPVSAE
jgi:aminopeptidase N